MLSAFDQPLTANQLATRTGLSFDTCRDVVRKLSARGVLRCLNPTARRSRLYWLTPRGEQSLRQLHREKGVPLAAFALPDVDWELYGWICYSHRAAVLRAITEPLQPATIKRRARSSNPRLRMSANNVRDIIKLFLEKGIVRPVCVRKKAHLRYEVTEAGSVLRDVLWRSSSRSDG